MSGVYRNIPAYSRMLERGEAQSPADVALVGTEAQLTHRIEAFGSAGVTDLCAFVFHVRTTPEYVPKHFWKAFARSLKRHDHVSWDRTHVL